VRFLRRLFAAGRSESARPTGTPAVLDGASAVAAIEARISDAAALHATYPASAAVRAWLKQERSRQLGVFDQTLTSLEAATTRSALASALGLTLTGQRTAAFASGADLAAATDLLTRAAGLNLPLVIHLVGRTVPRHGAATGGGHEAYHGAADTGTLAWCALNVQEAADLAIIARRVAEEALVPIVLLQDGASCAAAAQDLLLTGPAVLRDFVGDAGERIDTPTPSQRFVFGDSRRRLPRRHDLDLPMLVGAEGGAEAFALGAAAHAYGQREAQAALTRALDAFESMTGRRYDGAALHHVDDADTLLIVQGAAYEVATTVADHLRRAEGVKIGVLGVRFLRPLPANDIARACRGKQRVAVLERLPLPGAAGLLLREVQSACAANSDTNFINVSYGVGDLPLRAADLAQLARMLPTCAEKRLHLGLDFLQRSSRYPKRQAFLDALRGEAEDLQRQAVRADGPLDMAGGEAIALGVLRRAGAHEHLAGELAQLVHAVAAGHLRSRAGACPAPGGSTRLDEIRWSSEPLRDAGDEAPLDVLLCAAELSERDGPALRRLREGGTLLFVQAAAAESPIVSPQIIELARERNLSIRRVATNDVEPAREEALLAGAVGIIAGRVDNVQLDAKKLAAKREEALLDVPGDERAARLQALESARNAVTSIDSADLRVTDAPSRAASQASGLLKQFGRSDQTIDAVPRFFDQTAVLYQGGQTDELIADPYARFGDVPPATATFRTGPATMPLVEFDPATCDGNGRLWTSCPDGSILPVVISAKALLDVGLEMAAAQGKPADALRPVLNKIAKQVNRLAAKTQPPPTTARELLHAAFEEVSSGDAPAEQQAALAALVDQIGDLPLAHTAPFYDDAEQASKGSGELLCLIVNPHACRSPEHLVAACQGRGLKLVPRTKEAVERSERLCRLFEKLPDVSASTIERVREHPQVGPLAAMALSRYCAQSLLAGDDAEPASGPKLALRHVLTLTEFHLQPRLQQFLDELGRAREALAATIRELLAEALPTRDLDALAQGLQALARDEADLAGLIERVESASAGPAVDAARLRRLVDISRRLADLRWKIEEGPDGLGRARAGLALSAQSAAWAGRFPYNPFLIPVSADASGEAVSLARGLAEGQFQQVLTALRLLRWAKLEIDKPREAPHEAPKLAGLTYADLTAEERRLCPPLVLVGDGRSLATAELSQLLDALAGELPLKVVVLSDAAGEAGTSFGVEALDPAPDRERLDSALLAMLGRRAYVAQVSLAEPAHLAESVTAALTFAGPALVQAHAPSPQRHGFATERLFAQAELALRSRAWPIFAFDPAGEGVFGALLSLSGNPEPRDMLSADESRTLTPIDWAVTEARFADHFEPLPENASQPTPVHEYLQLEPGQRADRTPFVEKPGGETPQRLRVSDRLIRDADNRLRFWRVLQELAGEVTPFTDKVRRDAETDLEAEKQAKLEEITREYEAKLAEAENAHEADAVARLKQQLMVMAGFPGLRGNGGRT
jgi:pyruvate-ferredoxin/flavodoxin oxidoreductase